MSASIEFTGLPGSGKSAVVEILANKLEQEGYTVYEFRELAEYFRLLFRPTPRRLMLAWRVRKNLGKEIFSRGNRRIFDPDLKLQASRYSSACRAALRCQRLPYRAKLTAFSWRVSELAAYRTWQRSKARQREKVMLLADEAFTHRVISYFGLEPVDPNIIGTYLKHRPPFDAIVLLDQPIEVVTSRKIVFPWNERRLLHIHANWIAIQAQILDDYIASDPTVWTLLVEQFGSAEAVAQEVLGRIHKL